MSLTHMTRTLGVAIVLGCASVAQAADPLPGALNGNWMGTGTGGGQNNYEVKLVIDKQSPDGAVEGRITRWGRGCGAQNEPFKGTYDGTTFKFTSPARANVNTRVMGGDCKEDEWILKRASDGKSFEGTMGDVGVPKWSVLLKP
jgi:hypothetical protein